MNILGTGTVVGRYISSSLAGTRNPIPASGTITFTPQAEYLLAPGEATVLTSPIITALDSQGYVSTIDVSPQTGKYLRDVRGNYIIKHRGVNLQATDNAEVNPRSWTWQVDFDLSIGPDKVKFSSFNFKLPANSEVDLTSVSPVPGVSGRGIVRGEKGDSIIPLGEVNPATITSPQVGHMVSHNGQMLIHDGTEWKSFGSVGSSSVSESFEEIKDEKVDLSIYKVGRQITITGSSNSQDYVFFNLPTHLRPVSDVVFSGEGSVLQNGAFQLTAGTHMFSFTYVAQEA